jgi:hypothetical protein
VTRRGQHGRGPGPPVTLRGRRRIVIFTEGEITEPIYLRHVARPYAERTIVTVQPINESPLQIVRTAARERDRDEEAWCVFDKDTHTNVREAIQLAERKQIRVGLSVPCVELWFLLHVHDQRGHLESRDAVAAVRDALGFEKRPTRTALDALMRGYDHARRRAIALDRMHHGDGTPTPANPSSDIWRLVEEICRDPD